MLIIFICKKTLKRLKQFAKYSKIISSLHILYNGGAIMEDMGVLNFNQKKTLAAYKCFYNSMYDTNTEKGNNTEMHILVQKMCYLLKVAGIQIGNFDFCWNVYGPFSPGLLSFLRSIDKHDPAVKDLYDKDDENLENFLSGQKESINDLRKQLKIDNHQNDQLKWLELLGSLTFISRTFLPGAPFEEVNKKLIYEKSAYNDENYNKEAWEILQNAKLLSTTD